ncbi:MAG: transporter substrate-binding domain-containing protein [Alphaproteobacteria bacterium]|nr:transporter substrate-binding domain-containing protein [Alphaproteobacteria bacterium]
MNVFAKLIAVLLGLAAMPLQAVAQSDTLAEIQERGYLRCGVNPGQIGMSMADASGRWIGIGADLCRAVSAATLGDADAVEFIPVTARNRFLALQSGEIDLLLRNTTWTFTRDVTQGVDFVGPYFVDEEKVMVARESGIEELSQLNDRSVCVIAGGPSEVIMNDLALSASANINIVPLGSAEQYRQAYIDGRCVGIADGQAALLATRSSFSMPDEHVLIGNRLAYSPLSIGVRHGDDRWGDIVRWTFNALATAEALNVNQDNVLQMSTQSSHPVIRRIFNSEGGSGALLGLETSWAVRALQSTGNLGEIYDRSFGPDSDLPIERGPSALWQDGGMIFPAPFE